MKRSLIILLFAALAFSCSDKDKVYNDALAELDRTIARKDEIVSLIVGKTDSLRKELLATDDPTTQYSIEKQLYLEYARYDVDSALVYAHLKEDTSKKTGDKNLMFDAAVDLADRYRVSGEYGPALDIVNALDTIGISAANKMAYNIVLKNTYRGLSQTGRDPVLNDFYSRKMMDYVRLIQQGEAFMTADNADISVKADQPDLARKIFFDNYYSGGIPDKAHLHYFLAKTYRAEGDADNEILHYAISSNYYLHPPVTASRSLIRLARVLYDEKKETSRSFKYLLTAYEGAVKANDRVALEEANRFLPEVINSYEALKIHESRVKTTVILLLITLVVIMILFVILINKSLLKNLNLKKIIQEENTRINEMNARLEQQITQIKESNEIKDAYLGRYMSMFSEHIDSLERYRSKLRVIAKSQDIQEMQKILRSDDPIEEEQQVLLNEFDKTFLGIFPNFIEEFNSLLKEDYRIGKDLKPMTLSNELRIFALIRLGVSDSASIARFLRKSRSTVYNYRVKMRNGALTDREDFEKQLKKIGSSL